LLGKPQRPHEYLYWHYGSLRAVRAENWKAIRRQSRGPNSAPMALYNLETDLGETKNVASENPDVVKRLEKIFDEVGAFRNKKK